jgi:hypothetical protein
MFTALIGCNALSAEPGPPHLNRKSFDLPCKEITSRSWAASLSQDGRFFAAGWTESEGPEIATNHGYSFSGTAGFHVWNLVEGKELYRIQKRDCIPRAAAFSADGKLVAWVSDEWLQIVELETKRELLKAELTAEELFFVGFSCDGQRLVTESQPMKKNGGWRSTELRGTVRIWEIANRKTRRTLYSCRDGWISTCALSPDGRLLAIGVSPNCSIRVIDLNTCQEVFQLAGKAGGNLVFSQDGSKLASTHYYAAEIAVWDLRTGQKIRDLSASTSDYPTFFFSASGEVIVATKDRDQKWHMTNLNTGKEVSWMPDNRARWAAVSGNGAKLIQYGIRGSKLDWEVFDLEVLGLGTSKATAPKDLQPQELETLWNQLGDSNPRRALAATWTLADGGEKTRRFLAARVHPICVSPERTAKLIEDLDDNQFAVREAAFKELERYNTAVEGPIRDGIKKRKSAEVGRRLERLLSSIEEPAASCKDTLQAVRGIAALEFIGTAESKAILRRVAEGAPLARQTQEAKTALARMGNR